jgi:L-lactate permease
MKTTDVHFVIWSFIIGAVLFLAWSFLFIDSWNGNASLDIVNGAILEFFYFTVILQFINAKNQKKAEQDMEKQLDEIERLLEKVLSNGNS